MMSSVFFELSLSIWRLATDLPVENISPDVMVDMWLSQGARWAGAMSGSEISACGGRYLSGTLGGGNIILSRSRLLNVPWVSSIEGEASDNSQCLRS